MQVYVMTEATKRRLESMNFSLKCRFCGEPIEEGELCVSRQGKGHAVYAHKKCDEERRY